MTPRSASPSDWRGADDAGEALGEARARETNLAAELVDAPVAHDVGMQQR